MSGSLQNPADGEVAGDVAVAVEKAAHDHGYVDRRIDIAVCAVTFLLGLAIFILSGDIRQGSIHDPIGPDGWPKLLGMALMLTMGANIFRRLVSWHSEQGNLVPSDGDKDDMPAEASSFIRPFVVLGAGVLWMLVVPWTGFIVATTGLLIVTIALMKVRTRGKLFLLPLLLSLGIWLMFGVLFGIRLHAGPIEHALLDVFAAI